MSNDIYPALPGLKPEVSKIPSFATEVSGTDSGREFAIGGQLYARWAFRLQYEVLRSKLGYTELQTLIGFFLKHRGRLDDFLFSDPDDRLVSTSQVFGVGDGTTTKWQLVRAIGGAVEPIGAVDGTAIVTVNSTPTTAFTIDSNGVLTFTTAPTAGQSLAWTGAFFFRVRFVRDESEFQRFLDGLYRNGQIEFKSFRP